MSSVLTAAEFANLKRSGVSICSNCHRSFTTARSDAKFCSVQCRANAWNWLHRDEAGKGKDQGKGKKPAPKPKPKQPEPY